MKDEVRLTRTCYMCKEEKPLAEFPQRQRRCHECNRAYSKALHQANRANRLIRMRVASAARAARHHDVANTLTVDQWLLKLQQAKYKCEVCGEDWEEIHHVVPMGAPWSGPNSYENVSVRCKKCHIRAHQELWAFRKAKTRLETTEKRCRRCGEVKPVDQFYRREMTLDGRSWDCKVCQSRVKKIAYRKKKLQAELQAVAA